MREKRMNVLQYESINYYPTFIRSTTQRKVKKNVSIVGIMY